MQIEPLYDKEFQKLDDFIVAIKARTSMVSVCFKELGVFLQ